MHMALPKSLVWSHLKPWNRAIHVVGFNRTSHIADSHRVIWRTLFFLIVLSLDLSELLFLGLFLTKEKPWCFECRLRWAKSPILNRQSLVFSERDQLWQAIPEYYTNERQLRDSNRSATNAGSTRTNFCVFWGRYDRQRTLVLRVAAIILASDSQGGSGTELEPETGTVGTAFPETESGTGTARTVFQEPKPEPEPSFPVKLY